ncbi:MAG: GTPase Era [Bacteroidia bacterium]|nr:GTPase Era [Sphingobacteriaceae bacterium]MBK7816174.1 GTPase Era [Sphingobacteriaceae bacterium]MBP9068085.1 GTPase Era [Bacteroidia bacterium]
MTNNTHRAGFVNIIGCPNVGKSTLMNALVGEKLSIITSKAQTTRHRIMGIVSGPNHQIVFSDTPGILKPNYKLQEKMMQFVISAFDDADVFLVITDVFEDIELDPTYLEKLKLTKTPVLLLINKIDAAPSEKLEEKGKKWRELLPNAELMYISALEKMNLDKVMKRIVALLPEGEAFYDKEQLTDKNERFFVSEIIREKILLNYRKEIPYSVEINVNSFKDEETIVKIQADILVERDSQKGIIIGNKGSALKKVGEQSRKECEKFFGKKVYLELFVKVDKDWRNNDLRLKNFGY